jgi:hypothetical protein
MKISTLLDAGIFLAILTQMVSLSDLIILPEQAAKISRKVEDFTLHIEYLKSAAWFPAWHKSENRKNISKIAYILTLILFVVVSAASGYIYVQPGQVDTITAVKSVLWLGGLVAVALPFTGEGKNLFTADGLAENADKPIVVVARYILLEVFAAIVVAAFAAVGIYGIRWVDAPTKHGWLEVTQPLLGIGLLLFWAPWCSGVIALFVASSWDLVFILAGGIAILITSGVLGFLRGVMWRIVRYPKGPVAALCALVGVTLAIARVLLHQGG